MVFSQSLRIMLLVLLVFGITQFGLAFRYFVTKPGGFTNLLLLSVCQLIPGIGPIVIMGYRAEVAEALDRDDGLRRHPNFDFGRFVE